MIPITNNESKSQEHRIIEIAISVENSCNVIESWSSGVTESPHALVIPFLQKGALHFLVGYALPISLGAAKRETHRDTLGLG